MIPLRFSNECTLQAYIYWLADWWRDTGTENPREIARSFLDMCGTYEQAVAALAKQLRQSTASDFRLGVVPLYQQVVDAGMKKVNWQEVAKELLRPVTDESIEDQKSNPEAEVDQAEKEEDTDSPAKPVPSPSYPFSNRQTREAFYHVLSHWWLSADDPLTLGRVWRTNRSHAEAVKCLAKVLKKDLSTQFEEEESQFLTAVCQAGLKKVRWEEVAARLLQRFKDKTDNDAEDGSGDDQPGDDRRERGPGPGGPKIPDRPQPGPSPSRLAG